MPPPPAGLGPYLASVSVLAQAHHPPAFQDGYSLLGVQEVLHWGRAFCAYTLALLYLKLPEATLSSFSMQGG